MATDPLPAPFRFRDFELDIAAYQLRRNGKTVRLERRPMELLVLLATRHGHLVPRAEIVERLWPGKVVIDFDTGLNTLVSKVRHALQDSADAPTCIETVPGKGYRFIAAVEVAEATPASKPGGGPRVPDSGRADAEPAVLPAQRPRKWALGVVLVLVAVLAAILWYARDREVSPPASASSAQAVKSIAVLPFADLSPEQDQQYFSDGLSEEIITLLAQAQRMRVIARTSSFSFKDAEADIATVAKKLNVTHVLEGSVRKSGDRLRITAQLIDATTSSHLWSQTYDRELNDIFEVQSEIATSVARALEVTLPVDETTRSAGNAAAYEHFLHAQFFSKRRAPGDLQRASERYQQALEIDPGFARAWAGLASAYWIQTATGVMSRNMGLEKVRVAAERALALDPTLAEAHLRLANYHWRIGELTTGDEHRRKAFALEPNNPLVLAFAATAALREGRFNEAIEQYRRVVAADPLSALHRYNLASILFFAEQLDEARSELSQALELSPATPPDIGAFVLILDRELDEALALVQGWPEGAYRAQCLALIYHGLGRPAEADAALERLIEVSGSSDPSRVAEVYAYRGQIELAFQWLQRTVERNGSQLRSERAPSIVQFSPFLKPLHADARWDAWVASARAMSPR